MKVIDTIQNITNTIYLREDLVKEYTKELSKFMKDVKTPGTAYYKKFKDKYLNTVNNDVDIFYSIWDIMTEALE